MPSRRLISWSTAQRQLRDERASRAGIREERLTRTGLTTWHGLSGKRYVCSVQRLTETAISDLADAVVIAVARDAEGVARIVAVASVGSSANRRARLDWLTLAGTEGATELHTYRLADTADARRAVVADLTDHASALAA